MVEVDDFIEDFLQHEYDPVKAREYYLRTRKLVGRRSADPTTAKSRDDRNSALSGLEPKAKPLVKRGPASEERQVKAMFDRANKMWEQAEKLPPKERAALRKKLKAVDAILEKKIRKLRARYEAEGAAENGRAVSNARAKR